MKPWFHSVMKIIIEPGKVSGTVMVPPSKSIMQRACCAALLHNGETVIINPGFSADEQCALMIIENLGATVSRHKKKVIIKSNGTISPAAHTISCGESGLAARLFIPVAALSDQKIRVEGKGSLLGRSMKEFERILPKLAVKVESKNGKLPIKVKGPLKCDSIEVDGGLSSQYLSGLLFAFSFTANKEKILRVKDLKSKPYIDLTVGVLKAFGFIVENKAYKEFLVRREADKTAKKIIYEIEGDWSTAAFWIVAAAISGAITLDGLSPNSLQADSRILEIASVAGLAILVEERKTRVTAGIIGPFDFDATDSPDLFPILSVLAAFSTGESKITGLSRLAGKESNREVAIKAMLTSFGVKHYTSGDTLLIQGKDTVDGCIINGYNDHRIVMSAAIAALRAKSAVTITDVEASEKSYPSFLKDLASLGGQYTIIP
jgi:3-phosphoshikimate 1-carboxyvinyltransferase